MTNVIQSVTHMTRKETNQILFALFCATLYGVQVWENYEPVDETATTSGADEDMNGHASSNSPRETVAVTVTEVVSGSEFYVQVCAPDNPSMKYHSSICQMFDFTASSRV